MKIEDSVNRSVDLALVTKPAPDALFGAGIDWMRPLSHETTDSKKLFVRMPEGPFAIRVMSKHTTEMLVHISGKLVLRTQVAPGLQFIKKDGAGNTLVFGSDVAHSVIRSDEEQIAALSAPAADSDDSANQPSLLAALDDATNDGAAEAIQLPLLPDATEDSVFIVVRFVDDEGPGLKPPAQEFEVVFQMNRPADHDELVATRNLLTMVKPSRMIDEQDEVSFEPPQKHRPTFHCTCTGCTRGVN